MANSPQDERSFDEIRAGANSPSSHEPFASRQANEAFVQLLTAEQLPLLHYIARLLGDVNEAQSVLQETNLVLWRKSGDYQPGTKFTTWAHKVAYWQVMAYIRDRKRDRHVFNEDLIEQLANVDIAEDEDSDDRIALRHCLTKVSKANTELLKMRYEAGLSIKSIAESIGKSQSAAKVGLLRIRQSLQKCIERQLASSS